MKLFDRTESSAKRLTLLSIIAVCLSAALIVGRVICLLFFYDRIGYFKVGAILPIALTILYFLSVVFFAVAAIFNIYEAPSSRLSKPSSLAALLPCVAFIPLIISRAGDLLSLPTGEKTPWFELLYLIFSVFAAAYFLSLALSKQPSATSVILGVACVVWCAFAWMGSYLDFFVPMNSPDKLFFHLACIGCMLLVFSDIRSFYEIPKPKVYYFCFFTGLIAIGTSAIPSIIGNFAEVFASYSLLEEDIIFAAIFIYAAVRLFDKPQTESINSGDEQQID